MWFAINTIVTAIAITTAVMHKMLIGAMLPP